LQDTTAIVSSGLPVYDRKIRSGTGTQTRWACIKKPYKQKDVWAEHVDHYDREYDDDDDGFVAILKTNGLPHKQRGGFISFLRCQNEHIQKLPKILIVCTTRASLWCDTTVEEVC